MKPWHSRAAVCAGLVALVALEGGCWGRAFFHMPAETLSTSAKVDSLLRENAILRDRIAVIEASLRDNEERSRGANAQTNSDLEELKDQLGTLQEMLREAMESTPFTPSERRKPARADTARARPQAPPAAAASVPAPAPPPADTVGTASRASVVDSLLPLAGTVDTGAAGIQAPPPEEMFRQIYRDYSRREYQLALDESESFLSEFPDDPLCEEVLFIRGGCLMAQTAYIDALKEYSTLLQRYPTGKRAPGALLRMAVAYDAMGQTELAAGVARRLLKDFPNSEEAKVAEEQFAAILKE
jgi:TolA-binding protein